MFRSEIRQNLRQRISSRNVLAEVRNLKGGEVLIVKTAPETETIGASAVDAFCLSLQDGRKVLYHSLETTTTQVVRSIFDSQGPEEPLFDIIEGSELNVYKEISESRPDLYVIDAIEHIGDRAQNADELAHDLLVYYAVKYNTAIVAYVKSRTALGGDADYEYGLYGRELEMPLEGARNTSFPDWPQAFHSANYYERKILDKFNDRDYYMEFRRLLSKFKRLLELKDTFVRKSLKGCCFENVYELDEELKRFESAHPDKTPLFTKHFVEQMHTQMEFFGDRTGWLRHYFGLGVKPESFRKARLLAGTFFELKSSISSISHLFIRVAENYLSELRSREEGIKKDSAKY